MDQVEQLFRLADLETQDGRPAIGQELRRCADLLEDRLQQDPQAPAVLIAAARKRRATRKTRPAEGQDVLMPGCLPAALRRAVTKEVASMFDTHGSDLVKGALDDLRTSFARRFDAAAEKLKAAIRDQYGAEGLARYLPFIGEWRREVLSNIAEYGGQELSRMEQYGVKPEPMKPAGR